MLSLCRALHANRGPGLGPLIFARRGRVGGPKNSRGLVSDTGRFPSIPSPRDCRSILRHGLTSVDAPCFDGCLLWRQRRSAPPLAAAPTPSTPASMGGGVGGGGRAGRVGGVGFGGVGGGGGGWWPGGGVVLGGGVGCGCGGGGGGVGCGSWGGVRRSSSGAQSPFRVVRRRSLSGARSIWFLRRTSNSLPVESFIVIPPPSRTPAPLCAARQRPRTSATRGMAAARGGGFPGAYVTGRRRAMVLVSASSASASTRIFRDCRPARSCGGSRPVGTSVSQRRHAIAVPIILHSLTLAAPWVRHALRCGVRLPPPAGDSDYLSRPS